ncbi:MAG: class I adenylate-forming enzyme family protein [Hyphomicrobiaceae bacterium]
MQPSIWLGSVPPMRSEAHFDGRVVRCFIDRPRSAYALLEQALASNPDGEAIVSGNARLTYAGFADLVSQCAGGLDALGVGRGDRVALLLGNDVAFPVVLFAALRLGAIAVPISIREQTPGLAYMLEHCGAKVLVHDADLADRLPPQHAVPALAHRIAVQPGAARGGLDGLLAFGPSAAGTAPVGEEDTAVILYTSGTTGRPKGAMLTHLGICHSALHYKHCMGLSPRDRAIVAVPMSHVTGVIALIAAMVCAAGTLIVMPSFKAAAYLELSERERATHALLVPAMYNLCLLEPRFATADLSAWRLGVFGGAPMPTATIERLAQRLPGLRLMNAYGATETTSPATMMPPSETARRLDSVGIAVPCGEVLAMDEAGREVPHGAEGELWLRGPMVVSGYWNNPQATTESFIAGYWRSGDIGSVDADGFVRVFDRKKDMINRGGYKIYTIEVENVLMAHADVVEAAVVAKPCPVLGERAHAVVSLRRNGITGADLAQHCAASLADYKVPDTFSFRRDPLPRNANGKVMKRELREEVLALDGLG